MYSSEFDLIRQLFASSHDGFVFIDTSTQKILVINPSIEHLLGYLNSELTGKFIGEIMPQNSLFVKLIGSLNDFNSTSKKVHWQLRKKNGELINVDFTLSLISLENNDQPPFLALYIEDRSKISQLEGRINLIQSIFQSVREIKLAMEQDKSLSDILTLTCNSLQNARKFQIVWGVILDSNDKFEVFFSDNPKSPDFPILAQDYLIYSQERVPIREAFHSEYGGFFCYTHQEEAFENWCNFLNPGSTVNGLVVPLQWNNKTYGALEIIAFGEGQFTEDDISMLAEIGADIGFAAFSRETEEKRIQALKKVKYQIQLIDAIDIPIFSLDQMGYLNFANAKGLQLLDKSFSDSIKIPFVDLFKLPDPIRSHFLKKSIKSEIILQSNSNYPAIMQSFIIKDEESQVSGIMVIFLNLSDTKKTEEKLKNSQNNLRSLFLSLNLGIFITDISGIILEIVPSSVFELFQVEPPKLGFEYFHFLNPQVQQDLSEELKISYQEQRIITKEFSYSISNEERFYSIRYIPLFQSDISSNGSILLVLSDITESKIMNRQLVESLKFASLGEIAAGIAHEINNPLQSSILILDELIQEEIQSKTEQKEMLRKIESAHLRIRDLIRNLLDFGRIESPNKDLVSPYFILGRASELLELSCKKKGIIYSRSSSPNLPVIYVRWQEIEQVLINCVVNSVNAISEMTDKKTNSQIIISVQQVSFQNKDWILFTIEDNGPGMNDETLTKAFLPLYTTRRDKHGTGLGLSISKKIISEHDGIIDIKSKIGEGTTVLIYLPAIQDDGQYFNN